MTHAAETTETRRVQPGECHVWERCGGCPLMAISPERQRRTKLERLAAVFERAGVPRTEVAWVAGRDRDYRNRLRLRITDGRVLFFNPEKDESCLVLEPELRQAITELGLAAAAEPELLRAFSWLEVRGVDSHGFQAVCLAPTIPITAHVPDAIELARGALRRQLGVRFLVGVLGETEPPLQRFASRGVEVAVATGAFLQVNHAINRLLVDHVLGEATRAEAAEFVDLYAGCGNFALPLAARGLSGTAVESSAVSAQSLASGARRARLDNLRVLHTSVESALEQLSSKPRAFVIADPPRAGLGSVTDALRRLGSNTLLLLSCNPETLARDLGRMSSDYRLRAAHAFDMFPHTEHLEVAVTLTRVARA